MGVAAKLPWELPEGFGGKPEDLGEYGYVTQGGTPHGCFSAERLEEWCAEVNPWGTPHVRLVWTPDSERLLVPEEVPWLHDALRLRRRREARIGATWCAFGLLAFSPLLFVVDSAKLLRLVLVFYYAPLLIGLALYARSFFKEPRLSPEEVARTVSASRYGAWLQSRALVTTKWLGGCLAAVLLFQLLDFRGAIEAAGLVKPAVRAGEWWRLLTCSVLHVNFQHFWMNALALWGLGRLVEAHAGRWQLPLAFVAGVLCGSLASLVLLPDATSAGASGGLTGLVGFLAVVGYRRRGQLPPSFLRDIVLDIILIGLIGFVGYDFIDNAAHGGGLVGGAAAGLLLVPHGAAARGAAPGRPLRLAGVAALAILLITSVATILLILKGAGGR